MTDKQAEMRERLRERLIAVTATLADKDREINEQTNLLVDKEREIADLKEKLASIAKMIDLARKDTASDLENVWCRNATIILNAAAREALK